MVHISIVTNAEQSVALVFATLSDSSNVQFYDFLFLFIISQFYVASRATLFSFFREHPSHYPFLATSIYAGLKSTMEKLSISRDETFMTLNDLF